MNKFGIVMSLAAAAAITGCLDPDYKRPSAIAPRPVVIEPAKSAKPAPAVTEAEKPAEVKIEEKQIEEVKPVAEVKPVPVPEPEVTTYVVQSGDCLSMISQKFNVKLSALKAANGLKDDRIRVGQKLKLPGKFDVGAQKAPEAQKSAAAKSAPKATASTVYKGAVKEYIVKSGDTLGAIAYSNGLSIRQLKALNNLTSNNLNAGQKLQIPAEKPTAVKAKDTAAKTGASSENKPVEKPAEVKPAAGGAEHAAAPKAEPETPVVEEVKDTGAAVAKSAEPVKVEAAPAPVVKAPVVEAAETYIVEENDDVMSIAVRFNTSSGAIRELNNLGEDDQLKKGTVLKLPPDASEVE